jgi:hypothetical protein
VDESLPGGAYYARVKAKLLNGFGFCAPGRSKVVDFSGSQPRTGS